MFKVDLTKQYGILLSGGLDSAVLLYLLISNAPEIRLQPFTIPKFDGAVTFAEPIIDFLNKKYNANIPRTILVGDPTASHRMQSATAVLDIFNNYNIDYLYIGTNKIPEELKDYPGAPKRTARSLDPKVLLPFVDMLKDEILKLGQDSELLALTHSCTEQSTGRCNLCWQCKEREWAFSRLGLTDPGVK